MATGVLVVSIYALNLSLIQSNLQQQCPHWRGCFMPDPRKDHVAFVWGECAGFGEPINKGDLAGKIDFGIEHGTRQGLPPRVLKRCLI